MLRFDPVFSLTILLLLLAVSGCGIRPGQIDPPPGAEKLTFPRTYPDPASINPPPVQPPAQR